MTVAELLESFQRPESLVDIECAICNRKVKGIKALSLDPPDLLILQLNRFTLDHKLFHKVALEDFALNGTKYHLKSLVVFI